MSSRLPLSTRILLGIALGVLTGLVLGERASSYTSLFGTFFLFILISNFLGLIPGFTPPTSNFQTTLALGFASFVAFNYIGIRDQGLLKYLAHFAGPIWWLAILMFPLELVGTLVRPFSLGLRLFGNLTGDHLVLEIFTGLTKIGIPVIFYFFGTLVSVLQAFVFTLLTIIYVSLSVGHDDRFGDNLQGMNFGVWGLAFKPGTDDMREAPAIVLVERLLDAGANVKAYDPVAMDSARMSRPERWIASGRFTLVANQYDALGGAHAMALVTEWKPFRLPDFAMMKRIMKHPVVFDGRNQYDPKHVRAEGFEYYGIGR